MKIRSVGYLVLQRLLLLIVLFVALIFSANIYIESQTKNKRYSEMQNLPVNSTGLLLGTSKYSRTGGTNDHYLLRLKATYALFSNGKINYILISGDNSSPYYDEPTTIRRDLIDLGIPSENIYRDYEGYRTLDSVMRAGSVFGLQQLTIISQPSHNARALYIAQAFNIRAIAFNAGKGDHIDLNNRIRESLAKTLAFFEVYYTKATKSRLRREVFIGITPPT